MTTIREVALIAVFMFAMGGVCAFALAFCFIDRFFAKSPRALYSFVKHFIEVHPPSQADIDELCSVCKHRKLIAPIPLPTIPRDLP